jgi:hypothetical protein
MVPLSLTRWKTRPSSWWTPSIPALRTCCGRPPTRQSFTTPGSTSRSMLDIRCCNQVIGAIVGSHPIISTAILVMFHRLHLPILNYKHLAQHRRIVLMTFPRRLGSHRVQLVSHHLRHNPRTPQHHRIGLSAPRCCNNRRCSYPRRTKLRLTIRSQCNHPACSLRFPGHNPQI